MKWIGNAAGPLRDDYEERNRVSSYRGYLHKLRRSQNLLAPQWGKRWFSIEGHFLKWYRQESDLFSSGMIDLKYIRSISKLDNHGQFSFVINSDERNLILRAANLTEMHAWIRALHMHADIARGGKGTMVVSDFNQLPLQNGSTGPASDFKQPKRNRGLRASLTLEQELDLTLKKLEELAKEVKTSDSVQSPHATRSGRPEDDEQEETSKRYSTKENNLNSTPYQNMTNKLLKNVQSQKFGGSPFDESMESITDAVVRTPKHRIRSNNNTNPNNNDNNNNNNNDPNKNKRVSRIDSFGSVEDISLSAKPQNRAKSLRQYQNENANQNNNRDPAVFRTMSSTSEINMEESKYPLNAESAESSFDEYDHRPVATSYNTRTATNNNNVRRAGNPNQVTSSIQSPPKRTVYQVTDLSPISPDIVEINAGDPRRRAGDDEEDEFDFTVTSTNPRNMNNNNNNRNVLNKNEKKGSFHVKKISTGTNKYYNKSQFEESNDSVDFVEENIPSIDAYNENQRIRNSYQSNTTTRNNNNQNYRDDPEIPVRKSREYQSSTTNTSINTNGKQNNWASATNKSNNIDRGNNDEPVRNSRDFFGIKSAW
jgi:hypothetical protein